MNAANKLKYWDLYKDLYQVVTQGQPGQLPQQFLEEMARAYEHESTRAGAARLRAQTASQRGLSEQRSANEAKSDRAIWTAAGTARP